MNDDEHIKAKSDELELLLEESKEVTEQLCKLTHQEREITSLENRERAISRKCRAIYAYLDTMAYTLKPKLREIINKVTTYGNNEKGLFLINDDKHFTSIKQGDKEYHLELIFTHLRDYDITKIIKDLEIVLNMDIKHWFVSATNYTNGTSKISLYLTIIDKPNTQE